MGLDKMKSRYDKSSNATATNNQTEKEAKEGKKVGQTPPSTTNYFQQQNTLSPFDADKLPKEDQLVKLMKDQKVTSKMSGKVYDPEILYAVTLKPLIGTGVNSNDTNYDGSLPRVGYDVNGPHRSGGNKITPRGL